MYQVVCKLFTLFYVTMRLNECQVIYGAVLNIYAAMSQISDIVSHNIPHKTVPQW